MTWPNGSLKYSYIDTFTHLFMQSLNRFQGCGCSVGLRYMLDLWSGCWQDHQADIENGEIGLSQALLADGYNIASMQHEYAGLDFRRQPDKLQCKGRQGNPTFCCETPGKTPAHVHAVGHMAIHCGRVALPLVLHSHHQLCQSCALGPTVIDLVASLPHTYCCA